MLTREPGARHNLYMDKTLLNIRNELAIAQAKRRIAALLGTDVAPVGNGTAK